MNSVLLSVMVPMETWLGEFLGTVFNTTNQGGTQVVALLFYILFFMVIIDVVTGWGKGIYQGRLDSAKNYKGYIRKVGLFTVAILFIFLDFLVSTILFYMGMTDLSLMGLQISEVPLLSAIVLLWLILGEILSILENLAGMDIKLPKFVESALNRLQQDMDEGNINIKSQVRKDEKGNIVIENQMRVSKKESELVTLDKEFEISPKQKRDEE